MMFPIPELLHLHGFNIYNLESQNELMTELSASAPFKGQCELRCVFTYIKSQYR